MTQETTIDRSTLAVLHPSQSLELQWQYYKNSLRAHGSHLLKLKKPTRNPESARHYVKGDPVNLIDWKAYARTDQLIIREQHDEATARIRIAIDAGSSMLWPNQEVAKVAGSVPTKLEIATRVAFNLAHLHLITGDLVELWIVTDESGLPKGRYQPKSSVDVLSEFDRISQAQFSLEQINKIFQPAESSLQRKADVGYWLGDALSSSDHLGFLQSATKHRAFLHILSSLEIDTAWFENQTSYFDESGRTKEYQGTFLLSQENYGKSLKHWRERIEKKISRDEGGMYHLFTDKTSIHDYLSHLTLTE